MAPPRASLAPFALLRTTLHGLALPGQFLRRTAAPLDFAAIDPSQRRAIVRGLLGAMHAPPGGVGLSATMAGLDLRVVIASDGGRVLAMANPEIVATGGEPIPYAEGNLCLPDVHGEVVRPATVTVRWHDMLARAHEETFDGWLARILQHELELLDGRFFTDHVDPERLIVTPPARQAAEAVAAVYGEPAPAGDPHLREPARIATLPPDLLTLRCSLLRLAAAPVVDSGIDPTALRELLATLFLTARVADAPALSAPQIGVGLRVAVIDDDDQLDPPLALIDATVVERSDERERAYEQCASLPGLRVLVERPTRIRVRNHTPGGEPHEFDAEGARARLILRQLDQLDGRPLVDGAVAAPEHEDPQRRVQSAFKAAYS